MRLPLGTLLYLEISFVGYPIDLKNRTMAVDRTLDTVFNPQPNARSRMSHNYTDISIHGGKVQMGDTQYNYHGE